MAIRNAAAGIAAVLVNQYGNSTTYTRKGLDIYGRESVRRIRAANPGLEDATCSWFLRVVDGRNVLTVDVTSNITGRTYTENVAI